MTPSVLLKRGIQRFQDRNLPDLSLSTKSWEEWLEEIGRPPQTIKEHLQQLRREIRWKWNSIEQIKYDAEHYYERARDNFSWRDKAMFDYAFAKSMAQVVQEAKNLHDPDHEDCRYAPPMPKEYHYNPSPFTEEEYDAQLRQSWEEMEYKFDVMLKGFNGYVIWHNYTPTLPLDYPAWKELDDTTHKNMQEAIQMLGEMYVYLGQ